MEELSPDEWNELQSDYLEKNKDWQQFSYSLADFSESILTNRWLSNTKANSSLIKKWGMADRFAGKGINKIAVLIGASPAIHENYKALYETDDRFVLVAVNAVMPFLTKKKIKPDYVTLVDAGDDPKYWIDGKDSTTESLRIGNASKDIPLIATQIAAPTAFELWQGEIAFLRLLCGDKLDAEMKKITGIEQGFPAAGNVFNFAFAFAHMILGIRAFIFCGNELAFADDGSYFKGKKTFVDKDQEGPQRYPAMNIQGEKSWTLPNLYQYKLWLEDACGKIKGMFINATEAGILGVTPRYGRLPWIKQMTLKDAIEVSKKALKVTAEAREEKKAPELSANWRQVEADRYDYMYRDASKYINRDGSAGLGYIGFCLQYFGWTGYDRVLDLGCGPGFVMEVFERLGKSVYGIDPSPYVLNKRLKKYMKKGRVKIAYADKIPFVDNFFDLVFCSDVFEHIPINMIDASIEEMKRVGNSKFFITVPQTPSRYTDKDGKNLHQTVKSVSWWAEKFTKHGFEVMLKHRGWGIFYLTKGGV